MMIGRKDRVEFATTFIIMPGDQCTRLSQKKPAANTAGSMGTCYELIGYPSGSATEVEARVELKVDVAAETTVVVVEGLL